MLAHSLLGVPKSNAPSASGIKEELTSALKATKSTSWSPRVMFPPKTMLPVMSALPDNCKFEPVMSPDTVTSPSKVLMVTEDIVVPSMLPERSKV